MQNKCKQPSDTGKNVMMVSFEPRHMMHPNGHCVIVTISLSLIVQKSHAVAKRQSGHGYPSPVHTMAVFTKAHIVSWVTKLQYQLRSN